MASDARLLADSAPMATAYGAIGVTIDADSVHAAVVDSRGRIRYDHSAHELVSADTFDSVARTARRLVDACFAAAGELGVEPLGVGLAVPGEIGPDRTIRSAPRLGWTDVPMHELVPDLADVRLVLVDEADAGAVAEAQLGVAGDFLYLSGTLSGLSGALVLDGRLHVGASGRTPDIGHLVVDRAPARCSCGASGCLTQLAGLSRIARAALRDVTEIALDKQVTSVLERLHEGDPRSVQAVAEAGVHVGTALAAVSRIADPVAVVVGGVYTRILPWLSTTMHASLHTQAPGSPLLAEGRIVSARAGEDGSLIGAAMLAADDPAARERLPMPAWR